MNNSIFLADLEDMDESQLREHIVRAYEIERKKLDEYDFLIGYESVGSWGCDSSAFFLLRNRADGELYEVHASHCSCYGFEGQFEPEKTTLEYLRSDKFYFSCGGYDNDDKANRNRVVEYISNT